MSFEPITVLICARNASATIERAISSVMQDPDCLVILIDDQCSDDTVMRAHRIAGKRLKIINTPVPGGIALARQQGLDAIQTEFGAWLDADDTWIAGRTIRMLKKLADGADIAVDNIDLHDGSSGKIIRHLEVPAFIQCEVIPARLFERNYLPGDSQAVFRTALFRKAGGYDTKLRGAESFDILLRAISRGARFGYVQQVGYRMYAYPGSLSRNLSRQREGLRAALTKHNYEAVRVMCEKAGHQLRVADWVLVSMAIYREDYKAALKYIDEASPADTDKDEVLEPKGPWPICEGWRRSFQRGTILLLMGQRDEEAKEELLLAHEVDATPEVQNNLGVAQFRLGDHSKARQFITQAKKRFPAYLDARKNLSTKVPTQITTHPLRRQASRVEY